MDSAFQFRQFVLQRPGLAFLALWEGDLAPHEQYRARMEVEYWRYYLGQHWEVKRPEGEPQVTLNYPRAFVETSVAFLMGQGFSISVPEAAKDITLPVLQQVWRDNDGELTALELAQMGSISGNAFAKVTVETFDPEEDPEMYELYPKGRIRILVLPSFYVFPRYDSHDRQKMVECIITYIIEQTDPDTNQRKQVRYKEVLTRDRIRRWINNELIEDVENPLREIPVVHIRNIPVAGNPFGLSDLHDIVPIVQEMNEKSTNISEIIDYHAAPVTILRGAKASNMEKGARKVWSIPKDADAFNLELKSDLHASMSYLTFLKDSLFELAGIPPNVLRGQEAISNTTGIALQIKHQPIMSLTRKKRLTYGQGLRKINRLILKWARLYEIMDNIEGFDNLKPNERFYSEIHFPDPLPKDELIELQKIAQEMKLGLESRRGALRRLGVENIDEKIREIDEDQANLDILLAGGPDEALRTNIGGVVQRDEKAEP